MTDRELSRRVLVGLFGAPILLAGALAGGLPFLFLVMAVSLLAQRELVAMLAPSHSDLVNLLPGMIVGAALLLDAHMWGGKHVGYLLLGGTFTVLLILVARPAQEGPGGAAGAVLLSWLYIALPLAHLLWLRGGGGPAGLETAGPWPTAGLFVTIWAADTSAYLAGRRWGRHPLMPRVSPGKTVEGTAAGLLAAIGCGAALTLLAPGLGAPMEVGAGLGLLAGTAAIVGDLIESRLKRGVGAKDAGHILPGHGGILDRFDSLLLGAPILYYALALLEGGG